MKSCFALMSCSIVALLGLAALPAQVRGDSRTATSEYCATHDDFGLSHGACVAYFTTRSIAPHDASVCQSADTRDLLGVSNHGQCMKLLAELRAQVREAR